MLVDNSNDNPHFTAYTNSLNNSTMKSPLDSTMEFREFSFSYENNMKELGLLTQD